MGSPCFPWAKWVECIPLPSQMAEDTARAAVGGFFCRFGYLFTIFTDQGRNFESKLFKGVCKVLLIHKAKTTPCRPLGNGQVERYNRTLMDAVRCYAGQTQNKSDEYLPQISLWQGVSWSGSGGVDASRTRVSWSAWPHHSFQLLRSTRNVPCIFLCY